jgi:methionine aminotransferase
MANGKQFLRNRTGAPGMTETQIGSRSKLPAVGTTIFTVMSKLAAELDAINLSQGFPDFDCDPALVDAVAHHMRSGRNQYAPMQGVLPLREAIAAKYETFCARRYDPQTEVTVTSGGTEALFDAIAATVHAGDEVIVLEPCYDSYVPAIELSGGVPVVVSLQFPDYSIDWDALRRAVTPRTRMIVLNTPHNPTGAVWSLQDVEQLTKVVEGTEMVVLSDEVYEHIIFDGLRHESMARHDALAARSFIVGSFGKTYHTTGWKVGYAVAPAGLMAEFRKVHQFVTFATNTPVQHAIADFLAARRGLVELAPFYQAKRDLFLRLMEGSRFRPLPCRGSYFQLMDYSAITDEADADFAIRLTREHGVASIPTSPFLYRQQAPRVLRFCFAKKDETMERAAERLRRV